MPITLNGTTGITTPEIISTGGPLVVNASAPDNSAVINSAGNVGIGTISPNSKLTVVDGGATFDAKDVNGYPRFTQSSGSAQLGLFRSSSGAIGGGYIGGDGDNCFEARDSAFVGRLQVAQTGQLKGVIVNTTTMRNFYPSLAWVKFNGTGTVAINGSGNVTSITDNGTGNYTINFTTSMPDTNYSAVGSCNNGGGITGWYVLTPFVYSTGSVQVGTIAGASATDNSLISVSIFR